MTRAAANGRWRNGLLVALPGLATACGWWLLDGTWALVALGGFAVYVVLLIVMGVRWSSEPFDAEAP